MSLGALTFTNPFLLLALLSLPVLWWLLRLIPPSPKQITFPPIDFLLQIKDEASTATNTPLWLIILRTLIVALTVIGLAGPLWHRTPPITTSGPILLVVDNGWASAHNWLDRQQILSSLVDEAARQDRSIAILTTARQSTRTPAPSLLSPRQARLAIGDIVPVPWSPERLVTLQYIFDDLKKMNTNTFDIVWISDGLDHGALPAFTEQLQALGPIRFIEPTSATGAFNLSAPQVFADKFVSEIRRTDSENGATGIVRTLDEQGQQLGFGSFEFLPGEEKTTVDIALPLELRNRTARLEIDGHRSAAATFLIDERWRRRAVGIISPSKDIEKPLLSEIYYLEKALDPFSEIQKARTRKLMDADLTTILMPDQGSLSDDETGSLSQWILNGGTLVRFSSARLGSDVEDLSPVPLRGGGRALGGALSWDTPQALGPFPDHSPFRGLVIPSDVNVSRQVLAEPSLDLAVKTWAQLADGTPIVTAEPRGKGWLILFHTTSNPDWSNLPLSGLFVEMLRRIVDLSVGSSTTSNTEVVGGATMLSPIASLDGFGQLQGPSHGQLPVEVSEEKWRPSATAPPGLYGTGPVIKSFNLGSDELPMKPIINLPLNISRLEGVTQPAHKLMPILLSLALILAILDGYAVLWIAGALSLSKFHKLARFAPLVALCAVLANPVIAMAETTSTFEDKNLQAALSTRLAYVITGDRNLDAISKAGLEGLTLTLRRRTAAEPGLPFGVDLARDDLAFYPLLYWPVRSNQPLLSGPSVEKLNAYMARGGTLLIDSGDHQLAVTSGGFQSSPDRARMRQILEQLDVPPLIHVPTDHVLTKSFYLIQDYPGRWTGGALWVEGNGQNSSGETRSNDGVSSIIIGSNDYAAAWAIDETGRPRLPLVPGGPGQRESAMRFGVNLVLYTLTGNYKADQVHVPALLERLGQ